MPKKAATKVVPKTRHSPMEHPRRQYPEETKALQEIARACGLVEKIKWGKPCFTLEDKNIVLIQRFNAYIALMFFKGSLLKDPEKLLHRIGKHMQTPRQLRFGHVGEVVRLAPTIRDYIEEAIELERSGLAVARKTAVALPIPDELQIRLDASPALNNAFSALTPGRQRGYIYQIAAAKQSTTRAARVDKYIPQILAGKGLND
jgi:uncharacterized protein YdeI (YjbR/CyaY-like superfamily)